MVKVAIQTTNISSSAIHLKTAFAVFLLPKLKIGNIYFHLKTKVYTDSQNIITLGC